MYLQNGADRLTKLGNFSTETLASIEPGDDELTDEEFLVADALAGYATTHMARVEYMNNLGRGLYPPDAAATPANPGRLIENSATMLMDSSRSAASALNAIRSPCSAKPGYCEKTVPSRLQSGYLSPPRRARRTRISTG